MVAFMSRDELKVCRSGCIHGVRSGLQGSVPHGWSERVRGGRVYRKALQLTLGSVYCHLCLFQLARARTCIRQSDVLFGGGVVVTYALEHVLLQPVREGGGACAALPLPTWD